MVIGTRDEWLVPRRAAGQGEGADSPGHFNRDFSLFTEEDRRAGSGFNFRTPRAADINLSDMELHGLSAFARADGRVYHTYSTYDRGTDALCTSWQLLDRTPKGRGFREEARGLAAPTRRV